VFKQNRKRIGIDAEALTNDLEHDRICSAQTAWHYNSTKRAFN
jgi:hypothetical protein